MEASIPTRAAQEELDPGQHQQTQTQTKSVPDRTGPAHTTQRPQLNPQNPTYRKTSNPDLLEGTVLGA